jgi:hypothetical protein
MRSVHALTISRLDIQHYAFQQATGKRFFAPISEPQRAVDIGTGSGRWIIASVFIACIMSTTYQCLCRKWLPNFLNVNSLVLILPHYNRPPYCRKIVVLN